VSKGVATWQAWLSVRRRRLEFGTRTAVYSPIKVRFYLYMKTGKFCLIGFLGMFSAGVAFGQAPPPNDNFSNSIPVLGAMVTMSGTLAGATIESAEGSGSLSDGSVWWTWTAPMSSTVVIQMVRDFSPVDSSNTWLSVYSGTDLNSLSLIDSNSFDAPIGRYVTFSATAGNSYQLRVAGGWSAAFSLKLTATNPPVFLTQPSDYIVSPHGSAFFSAFASGLSSGDPFHPLGVYQWKFNGVAIPGQTAPSLLVHDVSTNQLGSYSVIASNANGAVESASAVLTMTDTNPVPRLAAMLPVDSTSLSLSLTGEGGRWYRVESSTNLNKWPVADWDWTNTTWIQNTNETSLLAIPRLGQNHFVRGALNVLTDVCVAQLKQMRAAQYLVAIEKRESHTAFIFMEELKPYLPLTAYNGINTCPEYGTYVAPLSILESPTCSLQSHGHKLTNP
jgi:hypothetical protein